MKQQKQMTVAEYLERAIEMSGKTQRQITEELGYPNPNIITMFKQGRTKVPINKIRSLARSLGVDPLALLRIVAREYMSDAWAVIEDVVGEQYITAAQRDFQRIIEEETEGTDIDLSDPVLNKAIREAIKLHHERPTKLDRSKRAEEGETINASLGARTTV